MYLPVSVLYFFNKMQQINMEVVPSSSSSTKLLQWALELIPFTVFLVTFNHKTEPQNFTFELRLQVLCPHPVAEC